MKKTSIILNLSALLVAFALAQTASADPISGCTNQTSYNDGSGTVVANFTCDLYPSSSSYNIDLSTILAYEGGNYLLGPGYLVVITGDPPLCPMTTRDC
jgi:hypothetical protein